MSLADILIDTIIYILNNTILHLLPNELSNFTLATFEGYFSNATSYLTTAWGFLDYFFNIELLLSILVIILTAEFMLHFGFKGIKYIINVFRGSGG